MSQLVVIQVEELETLIQNAVVTAILKMQTQKPIKSKMNKKEAAEYLGFSEDWLNKQMSINAVPYEKPTGGRVFFYKKDLDLFVQNKKSTVTPTVTHNKRK